MDRVAKIRRIIALLRREHGCPPARKKSEPIGELIRTVLSQNTTDKNSLAAFAALKKRFRSWEDLAGADIRVIAGTIRHAGLANIKARRIKEILGQIKRREGILSLSRLAKSPVDKASEYLRSLKGVGPKTAACVLLFSFNKPAMPVDTHIFRVAKRLGLLGKDEDIEEAHRLLTGMVPPGLIYDFHLCIIEHGRRTCKAGSPRCGACVLYRLCRFEKKAFFRRGSNDPQG